MGLTTLGSGAKPILTLEERLGEKINSPEGCINLEGNVIGTYLHGIFDALDFTRSLLNSIRIKKGLMAKESDITSFEAFKEKEYDKMAQIVRESVDMETIYKMIRG